jgi:branched-chain amino acid transport system substrate-binding protein
MEREASEVVKANGGTVLGSVRHPLTAPDFSSFLLQAQNSKAQIVGLANGGTDTINAIRTAGEFGIVAGGQKLVGLIVFINDIHALGLKSSHGLSSPRPSIGISTTKRGPSASASPNAWAARCRR